MTAAERKIVFSLLLLSLAVCLARALGIFVIVKDGIDYVSIAELMDSGRWSDALLYEKNPYHPGYPFFVFLTMQATGSAETAGTIVSVAMTVLTLLPVYLLARSMAGAAFAALAGFLYCVHGLIADISCDVLNMSTFSFFLASSVWLLWESLSKGTFWAFAGFGACAGLAFLTRVEGLVLLPVALVAGAVACGRVKNAWKRIVPGLAVGFVAAAAVASVYVVPLSILQGGLVVTHRPSASGVADLPLVYRGLEDRVVDFIKSFARSGLYLFAVVPLVGFAWLLRSRRKAEAWFLALVCGALLALLLVLVMRTGGIVLRYFVPAQIIAIVLAAGAVAWLAQILKTRTAAAILLTTIALAGLIPVFRARRLDLVGYRNAGEYIRRTLGPGQGIWAWRLEAVYYARGTLEMHQGRAGVFVARPDEPEDGGLNFSQFVASPSLTQFGPEFEGGVRVFVPRVQSRP